MRNATLSGPDAAAVVAAMVEGHALRGRRILAKSHAYELIDKDTGRTTPVFPSVIATLTLRRLVRGVQVGGEWHELRYELTEAGRKLVEVACG